MAGINPGPDGPKDTAADEAGWRSVETAAAELGPDWIPLRIAGALPFSYALLREDVGLAVIGDRPDGGAVALVKQGLADAGFTSSFGGSPPIVYRALPPPELSLAEMIEAAFALEPRPALRDAAGPWTEAARHWLTTPPTAVEVETDPPLTEARPMPAPARAHILKRAEVILAEELAPALASPQPERRTGRRLLAVVLLLLLAAGVAAAWHFLRSPVGQVAATIPG